MEMSDQDDRIKLRLELLEKAAQLGNVSEACRLLNCSRDTYYRLRNAVLRQGVEALIPVERSRPNFKNRVGPEVEEAVLSLSRTKPSYGKARVAAELKRRGVAISASGVAGIWKRHGLERTEKRRSESSLRLRIDRNAGISVSVDVEIEKLQPGSLLVVDIADLAAFLDEPAESTRSQVICLVIDVASRYVWARIFGKSEGEEGIAAFLIGTVTNERRRQSDFAGQGIIISDRREERAPESVSCLLPQALLAGHEPGGSLVEKAKGVARRVLLTVIRECFSTQQDDGAERRVSSTSEELINVLGEWVNHYNCERPHQGLSTRRGVTPQEALHNLIKLQ